MTTVTKRAGDLNVRCYFQRLDETPDAFGNPTNGDWLLFASLWGSLRIERGVERTRAGRIDSAVAANLRLLVSPKSRQITEADRVVISGKPYNIRAIMEPPRSRMIEMSLERGVAN